MKYLLALIGCFFLNLSFSQNVGIGTNNPLARLHVTDSNVVFSAVGPAPAIAGNFSFPSDSRGLIWYADKGAFRAGKTILSYWHKDSIGLYSFAGGDGNLTSGEAATSFGLNNSSIGKYSFAAGRGNYATSLYSMALGDQCFSSGDGAFAAGIAARATGTASAAFGNHTSATNFTSAAFGQSTEASGYGSFATGYGSIAYNSYSVAMGSNAVANGFSATSFGNENIADGFASFAAGNLSKAKGYVSIAMGNSVTANASNATAIGFGTQTNSGNSLAMGIWNDTLFAVGAEGVDHPLLMVGNGKLNFDLSVTRNNAFTVFNSGNAVHQGYTKLGNLPGDNAPSIKMKEISGATTAAVDGGTIAIPHGLDRSKIIGFSAIVNYGLGDVIPGFRATPGFEFSIAYDNVNIYIYNIVGNSANITSKPVKMVITYKE